MDISIEPDGADLQKSIDSLVRAGGGTLLLQPGRHITGPIRLFSGVTLSIGLGATLEFVPDYELYAGNSVSVIAEGSDRAYIVAQEAHDVAIVGDGKILASGAAFSTGFDQTVGTYTPSEKRPRVLVFEDCSKIRLEGFVIEDSPMWTVHLVRCRDVVVESITVLTIDNSRIRTGSSSTAVQRSPCAASSSKRRTMASASRRAAATRASHAARRSKFRTAMSRATVAH